MPGIVMANKDRDVNPNTVPVFLELATWERGLMVIKSPLTYNIKLHL